MAPRIEPQKLIAAIGAYGYAWNVSSHKPAEALGFSELIELARDRHAHVQLDKDRLNNVMTSAGAGARRYSHG